MGPLGPPWAKIQGGLGPKGPKSDPTGQAIFKKLSNDPGATPIIIISSLLGRLLNVTSDMLWLSRARAQVKQKVSHVTVSGFGRLGYTSEGFLKAGRTESKRCHM